MSTVSINPADLKINFARLKSDVQTLAQIGGGAVGEGVTRIAFSAADMASRRWLTAQLDAAGIANRMDSAANVFGAVLPGDATSATAADLVKLTGSVVTGSHLDSVPAGGHLDGALGVVAGLECLRVIHESGLKLKRPVELVAFSDEEGRFGGMFGSRAIAGTLTPQIIQQAVALDGTTLEAAMAAHDMSALEALGARRSQGSMSAFVELHIEQGPVLDTGNLRIGVVEQIIGLFKWSVRLIGEANHAGTTPMHLRRDAFAGLAEFSGEIPRILEEHGGDHSVATIGQVSLSPGAANSVPGVAQFSLDVRDTAQAGLDALADALRRALSPCVFVRSAYTQHPSRAGRQTGRERPGPWFRFLGSDVSWLG